MELVIRDVSRRAIAASTGAPDVVTIFRVTDSDPVIAAAAVGERNDSWGLWLEVSTKYPPQIAARDLKTLSHLTNLTHVVLSGEHADEARDVVVAMLAGGPVRATTVWGVLHDATNYPGVAHPLTVWSTDADGVLSADETLRATGAN